jgi:hypothetical protein
MDIEGRVLTEDQNARITMETTADPANPQKTPPAKPDYTIETGIVCLTILSYLAIELLAKRKGKSYTRYTGFF